MGKTIAYIRTSTNAQEIKNQRHEILEYGNREESHIDEFIEVTVSSGHSSRQRRIEELQERLQPGDTLLVTELSRLGRSTGEVILLINQLVAYGVMIIIIKQNLRLGEGLQDITSKVMVTLLALFAEIERDFISLRTKEALAAKKAQGVILGKPKGTIQSSMYDKDRSRIEELLSLGVPQKGVPLEFGRKTTILNFDFRVSVPDHNTFIFPEDS
jgi:DNA invertase Pin-like site-specific DNA recombinase